jgi:ABC-type oligopeptide transport system ATPase subunit
MAVMHRGTIVGIGDVDEVLGDPTHPYVKGLARSLSLRDRGAPQLIDTLAAEAVGVD